jgi:phage protein D
MATTQTPIPIFSQQETFYVPAMQVFVGGHVLASDVIRDVLQVTYKDSVKEMDSFDIEINNWDADYQTFKFAPALNNGSVNYTGIFDPGQSIAIWMGYQGNLRLMLKGLITSLSPVFSGAAPTLSISGLSELHQFRNERHTYSWTGDNRKTDTAIAQELCKWPLRKGHPGLGLNLEVNPVPDEKADPIVFMNNQFDILFLMERARRRGYDLYLQDGEPTQTLFFGLSENAVGAPVYRLEWGKSLVSFKPTLSTANQISAVTVRGWDRKTNSSIEVTYTLQQLWKDQKKSPAEVARLTAISKAFNQRTDVVVDEPMHTKAEAKARAYAYLNDRHQRLIEANATTVGLPDLRTGCTVEIVGFGVTSDKNGNLKGASSDFDGEYYVTSSTHTIGNSGYQTQFTARRQGPVSGLQ